MKLISSIKEVNLSEEQEGEFIVLLENNIKKYFPIPMFLIMLFQIYNFTYVSFYTNFKYQTLSSKVYMFLYGAMFLASIIGLAIIHKKNIKKGKLLKAQNYYIIFLIIWSLAVTIYDNRVSSNISVHLITLLSIAILVYLPPRIFIPLYLIADIVLVMGINLISNGSILGDNYGIYVNSTWLTIMAILVSYYHYQSLRQNFLSQMIIMEKSEQLDFIANHDTLTGLANRRCLAKMLNRVYLENKDNDVLTGALIIDIDDFKLYNDYYGHVKGDECLKRVANTLTLCLSDGTLIRYGGEEFVYLLNNTDIEKMKKIGDELCQMVERLNLPMPPDFKQKYLTISVGTAVDIVKNENSWKSVLQKADQALYQAKKGKKNQCVVG